MTTMIKTIRKHLRLCLYQARLDTFGQITVKANKFDFTAKCPIKIDLTWEYQYLVTGNGGSRGKFANLLEAIEWAEWLATRTGQILVITRTNGTTN